MSGATSPCGTQVIGHTPRQATAERLARARRELHTAAVLGASVPPLSWLELLAGVLAALLASPLLVVVHELAHALVARCAGLRVLAIELGRGTARRAFWLGRVNVVLRSWPRHGKVHSLLRDRPRLRQRVAAMALAGPLANTLVTAALVGLAVDRWTGSGRIVTTLLAVQACVHAVAAWSPRLFGGRTWLSSDLTLAREVLRGSEPELRATLPAHRAAAEHWRCFTAFARGDLDAAEAILAAHRLDANDPFVAEWAHTAALLALARGDAAAALREIGDASMAVGDGAHPQDTANGMERAFVLTMLGTPQALDEAATIAESWRRPLVLADPDAVAIERMSGWILVRRGQLAEGLRRLRRALRAEEPFWLQALTLAHLAEAHLTLGQPAAARRWAARARRLHRRSPLLPLLLDPLQPQLGAADVRASSAAIR